MMVIPWHDRVQEHVRARVCRCVGLNTSTILCQTLIVSAAVLQGWRDLVEDHRCNMLSCEEMSIDEDLED
eukprot:1157567-Pelagomonas_calceolata.AAC.3